MPSPTRTGSWPAPCECERRGSASRPRPRSEETVMDRLLEGYRRFRAEVWPAERAPLDRGRSRGTGSGRRPWWSGARISAGGSADRVRCGTGRAVRGAQRRGPGAALPPGCGLPRHQRGAGVRRPRPWRRPDHRARPCAVRRRPGDDRGRARAGARLRRTLDEDRRSGPAPARCAQRRRRPLTATSRSPPRPPPRPFPGSSRGRAGRLGCGCRCVFVKSLGAFSAVVAWNPEHPRKPVSVAVVGDRHRRMW